MNRWTSTLEMEATSMAIYEKISFKGKLTYSTQQIARQKLYDLLSKTNKDFVLLDVSELSFIDSTGLAVFIHFLKQEVDKNRKFIFVFSNNDVLNKLLMIAKFHKLFPFAKTEQEVNQFLVEQGHLVANQEALLNIWVKQGNEESK
ncbi:STAS domain-containing protein [Thermaerobacillus caldiproteolyticus]|uniref:Anti-anti-sigma factor n=1 Tax=Thermaerobacillus caldiproteolyticus TaxID=247480 RepID=A0A7W0BY60_9BACL|nr:STAS domain-containing protein [Anoxybacillus caldiproteolyticus]MBA2875331.1 anti-anti-sigma factor [Anoxybacillus caldiproteolyticus]QPA32638.1 STAS domain-containing protein [Anoxybacillus caldiproteolyticus]